MGKLGRGEDLASEMDVPAWQAHAQEAVPLLTHPRHLCTSTSVSGELVGGGLGSKHLNG